MARLLTRRSVLAGSLAAAAAASLAACGGSGKEKPQGNPSGASGDPNKLVVWAWDKNFNIYALQEAEKIYQKDHPEFSLEISEIVWDDLQQKITALAQSDGTDQLPDIFLCQNMAFEKNVNNYGDGVFADFEGAGIDYSQFPESAVGYSHIDDVHYGLPFDSGTAVTALRTDYLEQAGFKVEDFTDISWSKFIEHGKTVLEKLSMPMLSSQTGAEDFISMMLRSGGSSLFTDSGEVNIEGNEVLLKSAEIYKQLVETGVLVEVNSWDEYINKMTSGNVVGVINGIWISGTLQTAKDQSGKWGVTNVPSLDGVSGATNYTANGGSSWAISSNANISLAGDFLKSTFAGSTELYDTILPSSGAVANWLPAGESEVYKQPVAFYGNQPIYSQVVEYGSKVPTVNTGVYYYEARNAVSDAMTSIIGGEDPTEAFKKASETTKFAMG